MAASRRAPRDPLRRACARRDQNECPSERKTARYSPGVLPLQLSLPDLDKAKLEHIVRPLSNVDVRTRYPGQRASIQGNQRQIGIHEAQRIADQLSAARHVGLDADRIDELVE